MTINRIRDINKRYFKIVIEKKLIISFLSVLIVVFIFYYINTLVLNILSLIIAVIYAILINQTIIKAFFEIAMKKLKREKNIC